MSIEHLFDSYAATYNEKFNQNALGKYQRETVQHEIVPYLKSAEKILDVGCGPGSDFDFYKSLDLEVDAIDISPRMIEFARKQSNRIGLKANIQVSSLEKFQSTKKYKVIILNFGVINSFNDLDSALDGLIGLLKEKGILVIVAMPPVHLFFTLEMLLRIKMGTIIQRIIKRKVDFKNGIKVGFYNKSDFEVSLSEKHNLTLIKRINLGWLLPSPDQYQRWNWVRWTTNLLKAVDRKMGSLVPDFFGGDHVCYVFQKN